MANDPVKSLKVAPGSKVRLRSFDTGDTFGWHKESAVAELEQVKLRLEVVQQRLFGEERRSLLLVLQAMDAAGKDGTIRSIFSGMNPAGVTVSNFGVPSDEDAAHDYLWRAHAHTPAKGRIGVFNRSYYEDLLVVRVKGFVPRPVWSTRFDHINAFEQLLVDEGTTVVKVFLNVSKEVQRQRLQERLDDPEKRWKFRKGDLDDRKLWPEYAQAYEDVLTRTSQADAPWYVVPADHNWVRNLVVAKVLLHHLERMKPRLPESEEGLEGLVVE